MASAVLTVHSRQRHQQLLANARIFFIHLHQRIQIQLGRFVFQAVAHAGDVAIFDFRRNDGEASATAGRAIVHDEDALKGGRIIVTAAGLRDGVRRLRQIDAEHIGCRQNECPRLCLSSDHMRGLIFSQH